MPKLAGISLEQAPEPKVICDIAAGQTAGHREAAVEAFRRLGDVAGDAIAQALTLIDGLAVIGGGIAAAAPLFLPSLVGALNDVYRKPTGPQRRLIARAFNLEDATDAHRVRQGRSPHRDRARRHANRPIRSLAANRGRAVAAWNQRGRRGWGLCLRYPRIEFSPLNRLYQGDSL